MLLSKFLPYSYKLSYWYGGIGNNIQQLLVAIYKSILYEKNLETIDHVLFRKFEIIQKNKINIYKKKSSFFFDYESLQINITNHLPYICRNYLKKNFKFQNFYNKSRLTDKILTLYIRSGDIFSNSHRIINEEYIQNPYIYYVKLLEMYNNAIIVTQDYNNPIVKKLSVDYGIEVISQDPINDFLFLMNSTNIATSGVGTFPIAAALLSNKLKNFYFSNIFSNKHLNPKILKNFNFNLYETKIKNYVEKWKKDNYAETIMFDSNLTLSNFKLYN